jgi:hypothetical protein
MPILVHIADEKNAASIVRSGIRPGKHGNVVYFMPVLMNHFISHQWVRELRRSGARVLVGVYFRLPSSEMVWAGRYNEDHRHLPLGEAIAEINSQSDPLGYEIFIEREIEASTIIKVRNLPQKTGWRYQPHVHGIRPCGCPACTPRGAYGSRKFRDEYDAEFTKVPYDELKRRILQSEDIDSISAALWRLRDKRRRSDPAFLERVLQFQDDNLHEDLAVTLACFRHKNTRTMLVTLCAHPSAEVRAAAAESAYGMYGQGALEILGPVATDPVIRMVIEEKQRTLG